MSIRTNAHGTKAFTLIELLVVIAIIGLLATLATVTFGTARMKGRDTKRIADVKTIMKALELYYNDNGGYIRSVCSATTPSASWCNSSESVLNGHWIRWDATYNLDGYIAEDPVDPGEDGVADWPPVGGGSYFYNSRTSAGFLADQWYMIVFGLEQTDHPLQNQDGVQRCGGSFFDYGSGSDGVVTLGVSCKY